MESNMITTAQNRHYESEIVIMENGEYYDLKSDEKLVFGIKKNSFDEGYILTKTLTSEDKFGSGYLLTLTSKELNIPYGSYCYDVALVRSGEELYKIIGATKFKVIESVVRSDE